MSNKSSQIREMMNTASAAAPDVTKPLKSIGDGSMLNGVKNVYDYALIEGEKKGLVKGGVITIGISAVLLFVPKGIKFVKKKINDRTTHNKLGEKIYTAFNNELAESDVGVGEIDEECENKEA